MAVIIGSASAARLAAEGAICFDTGTSTATCDGLPVSRPAGANPPDSGARVVGHCSPGRRRATRASAWPHGRSSPTSTTAYRAPGDGASSWRVATTATKSSRPRPDGQTSTGAGALSRAE